MELSINITDQINKRYREYALYVLQSRGIPNFYDSLTPVQRIVLLNSPSQFNKTIGVVGEVIRTGLYHHGDCLDGNTIINLTNGGSIKIQDWAEKFSNSKMKVISIDQKSGEKRIGIGHSPRIGQTTTDFFEIVLENGEVIKCTGNHPFLVQKKWVKAEDLLAGFLLEGIETTLKISEIKKIKSEFPINFYDITVNGYHNFSIGNSKIICHNSSLSGAIAKLARPFGCSHQILEGDGFFGSPVNPAPSAARYTSVRINPQIKSLANQHMDLNEKNEEGGIDYLNIEVPIGLLTHTIGIAVGYRSNILPRRMEDIVEYLDGKNKVLKPYFKDFSGKIFKFGEGEKTWLIESGYEVNLQKKSIQIFDLPPVMRYDSFMDKLNSKLDLIGHNYKMKNESQSKCDLTITFGQVSNSEMEEISKSIKKITQIVIREDIVFVKDGAVSEFFSIKEYLDSFKFHLEDVKLKRILRDEEDFKDELSFLEAKLKFLIFMSQKKRISKEIEEFLFQFSQRISSRLSLIQIVKLSEDHIKETQAEIIRAKENIKKTQSLAKTQKKKISDLQKIKSKPKTKSLIPITSENIPNEIEGIEVFNIQEDNYEEEHSDEIEL